MAMLQVGGLSSRDGFELSLDAEEIGADPLPSRRDGSARRVFVETSGRVVFGDELPISIENARREIGPPVIEPPRSFFRLEIRARRAGAITTDDTLAIAEHPYSTKWQQVARFRSKTGASVGALPKELVGLELEEVLDAIDRMPTDPWQASSKQISAALCNPGASIERTHKTPPSRTYVFGVCDQPDKAIELVAKAMQVDLQLIRKGRYRFTGGPKELAVVPGSELAFAAVGLLFVAIRQAVAGPREENRFNGEPVELLAREIFHEHLYNLHRSLERKERRNDGVKRDVDAAQSAWLPAKRKEVRRRDGD